jgi:hypothetical protein
VEIAINQPTVDSVVRHFELPGTCGCATPFGNGHINDTYRVACHSHGSDQWAVLQRINHQIFRDPVALMENIERVTAHLALHAEGLPDATRRVIHLMRTHEGKSWHRDEDGNYWRAYRYIDHARSLEAVESTEQAFQAARAFGDFQRALSDLPAPRLFDTIPDFHHTPKRFATLEKAIEADAVHRAKEARAEIEFAMAHKHVASVLLDAGLPERVTHNDTKVNNVLLDEATGEAICVVDLDTVMPGLALYDFGDMVRTATSPALEDELDLSKVGMQFPMFEALVRGYLESAGGFLTKKEKALLAFSGKLITFEVGIRFLTDYLSGDTYFKVHRTHHNLDRCRTQFKLVESIEQQEEGMNLLVEKFSY